MRQSEILAAIEKATGVTNGVLKTIDQDTFCDLTEDSCREQPHFTGGDYNPAYALGGVPIEILGLIAQGKINVQDLAKRLLESSGYNEHAKWVGFKGNKIK